MALNALQLLDVYEAALLDQEPRKLGELRQAILYRMKANDADKYKDVRSYSDYQGTRAEIHPIEALVLNQFRSHVRSGESAIADTLALFAYCSFGRRAGHVFGDLDLYADQYTGIPSRALSLVAKVSKKDRDQLKKMLQEPQPTGPLAHLLLQHGWVVTHSTWQQDLTDVATNQEKGLTSGLPSQPLPKIEKKRSQSGPTLF